MATVSMVAQPTFLNGQWEWFIKDVNLGPSIRQTIGWNQVWSMNSSSFLLLLLFKLGFSGSLLELWRRESSGLSKVIMLAENVYFLVEEKLLEFWIYRVSHSELDKIICLFVLRSWDSCIYENVSQISLTQTVAEIWLFLSSTYGSFL